MSCALRTVPSVLDITLALATIILIPVRRGKIVLRFCKLSQHITIELIVVCETRENYVRYFQKNAPEANNPQFPLSPVTNF